MQFFIFCIQKSTSPEAVETESHVVWSLPSDAISSCSVLHTNSIVHKTELSTYNSVSSSTLFTAISSSTPLISSELKVLSFVSDTYLNSLKKIAKKPVPNISNDILSYF